MSGRVVTESRIEIRLGRVACYKSGRAYTIYAHLITARDGLQSTLPMVPTSMQSAIKLKARGYSENSIILFGAFLAYAFCLSDVDYLETKRLSKTLAVKAVNAFCIGI